MSARDLARLEAVVGILTEWAAWMQGYSPRLGYPNHSAMLSSGGNSDTFEDMCDAADAQRNQSVDSCVDDLPPNQKAAVYRRYLAAVFRMRDYEGSLVSAHVALEISLRRKGMMW